MPQRLGHAPRTPTLLRAVARGASALLVGLAARGASGQPAGCAATPTSLTPTGWRVPVDTPRAAPATGLHTVAEIPLPGPANRFDYQSIDPAAGRLYLSHMNAGQLVVVDLDGGRLAHPGGHDHALAVVGVVRRRA